jgi:8-hydroxy-5-deazaflavin:NADPH oxidoreductase
VSSSAFPEVIMKIGIIGSGNVGTTLTRGFRSGGHEVIVANTRGPQSLTELAADTGARSASVQDAIQGGEIVAVAVPLKAVPDLPANAFRGKLVIDVTNYYPQRDGRIHALESGTPSSRWVAQQLPGAEVVKAFNTIEMGRLATMGRPAGAPNRLALPVAGDDEQAKHTVMGLVEELGFDAVDAGGLDDSWRQQPGTPVSGTDLDADRVRSALRAATPD